MKSVIVLLLLATLVHCQFNNDRYNQQSSGQYNPSQYQGQNQGQYPNYDSRSGDSRPGDSRQYPPGQYPPGQVPPGQYDPQSPYNSNNQQNPNYPQGGQYDRDRNQYDRDRNQYNPQGNQYDRDRNQYNPQGNQYDSNRNQYTPQGQYPNDRNGYNTPWNSNNNNSPSYQNDRNQFTQGQYDPNSASRFNDVNCCEDYCYKTDEQPYLMFGTKRAYSFTFGKSSTQHRVPQCRPVQFWQLIRHGTRLPDADKIMRLQQLQRVHDDVKRNYMERKSYPDKGRLCQEDFQLLMNWNWNNTINYNNANSLTDQGISDIKFMARRYQTRFKELLSMPYSESYYFFQYTDSDRTHDSYQAYIEGLFGQNAYSVHANVKMEDYLNKPYRSCNAWQNQVDNNPDTMMEYFKFKDKTEYKDLVTKVFRRLGFRYNMNDSIIEDMYDMCRYEKAWYIDKHSPWCAAFNKEQLKLLEYGEDLKYYYKSGYGHDMNKQVGCPPLKDMYEKFERTVNGNTNEPKVAIYFTHTTALQTLLVAMGLYKDYIPLTADNYFTQNRRQWKTSNISPFAGNLAAILYECDSGEKHRVMFFLNEIPVDIPECSVGLCNWSTIEQKFGQAARDCNLDFCDRSTASTSTHNIINYLVSLVVILIVFKNHV